MQSKLRPGDTFTDEIGGITYTIRVMSVAEHLDATDRLTRATQEAKDDAAAYIKAWLEVIGKYVTAWSEDAPLDDIRHHVTYDTLGELFQAVYFGNRPGETDLKN